MVRNELPLLKQTIPYWKSMCDHLLIVDDNSTDGTGDYLKSMGVEVRSSMTKVYDQAVNTKYYLKNCKYDWVIPFDADELLFDLILPEDRRYDAVVYRRKTFVPPYEFNGDLREMKYSINPAGLKTRHELLGHPMMKVIVRGYMAERLCMGYHGAHGAEELKEPRMWAAHFPVFSMDRLKDKKARFPEVEPHVQLSVDHFQLGTADLDEYWRKNTYEYLKRHCSYDVRLAERIQNSLYS